MAESKRTSAVHAADISDANAAAVRAPISMSTTFHRNEDGSIGEYLYSRYSNPNRDAFEKAMALLEGGIMAVAFSSGLAATMAVLQTLQSGDHLIIPDDAYYGLRSQLTEIFGKFGLSYTLVDCSDEQNVVAALQPQTRIVWIETPSNPSLKITDIARICSIAHDAGAIVVCDNTWATPLLQQPLALACDVVLHSVTKYIAGHSDVLMGVVIVKDESMGDALRSIQRVGGAVPSPFECWLASRGLQTLPVRLDAASRSASRIAEHFSQHSNIEKVLYPSLHDHPGTKIASTQMSGSGAMLSMLVKGTGEQSIAVASAMKLFIHATSLGGVESLVEHRASVEPVDSQTPHNLLRFSIGLEQCEELIADIENALYQVFGC